MNRKLQTLRSIGMLALMAGGVWAAFGCGTTSNTFVPTNPTDTAVAFGQRLYVADTATNTVSLFNGIDTTANGSTLTPSATFSSFKTVAHVNVDFFGDLLVADSGNNAVDSFANAAEQATTTPITTPTTLINVGAHLVSGQSAQGVAFDSSHSVFFVATGTNVQIYNQAGTFETQFTIPGLSNPVALAVDDQTLVNGTQSTLFAVGTNGGTPNGAVAVIESANTQTGTATVTRLLTQFSLVNTSNVAVTINMNNPTAVTLDGGDHLWIADPAAQSGGITGRIFRIDNATDVQAASTVSGGALQISADSVAVDTSNQTGVGTGAPVLITGNSGGSNNVSVFVTSEELGNNILTASVDFPITPTTIVSLTGISHVKTLIDDSLH